MFFCPGTSGGRPLHVPDGKAEGRLLCKMTKILVNISTKKWLFRTLQKRAKTPCFSSKTGVFSTCEQTVNVEKPPVFAQKRGFLVQLKTFVILTKGGCGTPASYGGTSLRS